MLDVNIATCYMRLRDFRKVIENCKMALSIDKKCIKAHYRIAQAYLELSDLDAAGNSLKAAIEHGLKTRAAESLRRKIEEMKQRQKEARRKMRESMAAKFAKAP
mmetsp:Transcript_28363/g.39443  ORF Transcript_28363/g.39443 Transcript_28363/m.39443 type:complete len:104 (-) Transcript_28363:241-552(-)